MEDEPQVCINQTKFNLYSSNNEIFVWDKKAVVELRQKYRILGSLVGSLPSHPRQNLVNSLPLVLLPEEAKLLQDENIATIVQSETSRPSPETLQKFQDERSTSMEQQIERLQQIKQQKLDDFAEIIKEGQERELQKFPNRKRKKKTKNSGRKKLRTEAEGTAEIHVSFDPLVAGTSSQRKPEEVGEAHCKPSEVSNKGILQDSTLVCVSTATLPRLQKTVDTKWKFPETERERVRYKVFSDLWRKGYYISNGSKFGGDYLVYPNDPLRYHSHFIVRILPWQHKVAGLDLVSIGRLGSTVKKTSVLASVDATGKIIYTSIQWSGFT